MDCVTYGNGILFFKEGQPHTPSHELYLVFVRGVDKRFNGHLILNYKDIDGDPTAQAQLVRLASMKDEDEGKDGCGIGYFLRNGEMDYLSDEALQIRVYAADRNTANDAKMAFRSILDAICIFCPASAYRRFLPFAPVILAHLETLPQLRAIVPTLEELQNKVPFSRFLVGTVATDLYYNRGPRGTIYLPGPLNFDIRPWNLDQDTLSIPLRLTWSAWIDEDRNLDAKRGPQPTTDTLKCRRWLESNYAVCDPKLKNEQIRAHEMFQHYKDTCVQERLMVIAVFARVLRDFFPDVISYHSNSVTYYVNLERTTTN